MTPYEAIYSRQSIRKYRKDAVDEEIIRKITAYEADLIPMFPMIRWCTKVYTAEEYGRFEKGLFAAEAPYYLLIYAQPLEGYRVNAGSIMEQIALYLHSKGIGTCFIGGLKPPKGATAPDGMEFVIGFAFGYPKGEINRYHDPKREPLDKLCVFKQEPMDTTLKLLESARLAPSAVNGQPWKFVVYKNRIHIFSAQKKQLIGSYTDIDMGIMIAHMQMTAEEYWIDLTMTRSENLKEKPVAKHTYLGSVLLKI